MNKDSGHTWGYKEDFPRAVKDLEASRARVKELEIAVAQLQYAIKVVRPEENPACSHAQSSYNGQASWCYLCKRVWLVSEIAEGLGFINKGKI